MQEIFSKRMCFEKGLSKNSTLFFLSNTISFNEQDQEKKGPDTSDQSPIRL